MAQELSFNQQNFIQYELSEWAKGIEQRLKETLQKKGIVATGDLLRSLSYKIFAASGENSGEVQLSFLQYGRLVDMGAGRIRKIESNEGNAELIRTGGKYKPQKWYASVVWPNLYGYLIERLIRNYQENIVYEVKLLHGTY